MATNRETPEVNAGSMADIAFLLLIFFLVTTTLDTDEGLDRLLPKKEIEPRTIDVNERNVLRVNLNSTNMLLVEDAVLDLKTLRKVAFDFLDNGGALPGESKYCDYCKGKRDDSSSDNPIDAIIALHHNRETTYGFYIAVQNELVGAYNDLRNREAQRLFKQSYVAMTEAYYDEKTPLIQKEKLKKRLKRIQKMYPQKIVEPEVFSNKKFDDEAQ
ncbi:biopolymer transporter ExbD [Croceitalea sp. MTPC5]|uniref:ExbD/TolR family protein n=1 Tax=Croceitalea sp. MTPC5 TaxID=3056565 RepID=UPI002B3C9863|nr:biopolymer transporter ExbD [Croceitalea sp. MTPC5]